MGLYKYKNCLLLLLLFKIIAAFLHATEQHISLMGTLQEIKAFAHTTQLGCLTVDRSVGLAGGCCGSESGTDWCPPCAGSSALPASTGWRMGPLGELGEQEHNITSIWVHTCVQVSHTVCACVCACECACMCACVCVCARAHKWLAFCKSCESSKVAPSFLHHMTVTEPVSWLSIPWCYHHIKLQSHLCQ